MFNILQYDVSCRKRSESFLLMSTPFLFRCRFWREMGSNIEVIVSSRQAGSLRTSGRLGKLPGSWRLGRLGGTLGRLGKYSRTTRLALHNRYYSYI